MVIIKSSTYTKICPFSKKIIKPNDIICLFNQLQFNAFKELLYKQLSQLPSDIVDIIIKKTKYEKFIHCFGHKKYAFWTKQPKQPKQLKHKNKYYNKIINNYNSFSDSSNDYESDY